VTVKTRSCLWCKDGFIVTSKLLCRVCDGKGNVEVNFTFPEETTVIRYVEPRGALDFWHWLRQVADGD